MEPDHLYTVNDLKTNSKDTFNATDVSSLHLSKIDLLTLDAISVVTTYSWRLSLTLGINQAQKERRRYGHQSLQQQCRGYHCTVDHILILEGRTPGIYCVGCKFAIGVPEKDNRIFYLKTKVSVKALETNRESY